MKRREAANIETKRSGKTKRKEDKADTKGKQEFRRQEDTTYIQTKIEREKTETKGRENKKRES